MIAEVHTEIAVSWGLTVLRKEVYWYSEAPEVAFKLRDPCSYKNMNTVTFWL